MNNHERDFCFWLQGYIDALDEHDSELKVVVEIHTKLQEMFDRPAKELAQQHEAQMSLAEQHGLVRRL